MKDKSGFTLIELLAVIIILGVIMLIAMPSVTRYIKDSRKNTYVDTARKYIEGAANLVNSGELDIYDTDTTYYIPSSCISLESGGDSPYGGKFNPAYILVTYNDDSYNFYWMSRDDNGIGIKTPIASNDLDINQIETEIKVEDITATIGMEGKNTIIEFSNDCSSKTEHKTNTKTISGTIIWDDNDNQKNDRPSSVIVNLYADGEKIAEKEVTSEDNWNWAFDNLTMLNNNKEIVYTIDENSINKYIISINEYVITNKRVSSYDEYDDIDDSSVSTIYVARVRTKYYTSLQTAINSASYEDTVYLLKNRTENVTNNKTIRINLKNHTLTGQVTNGSDGKLQIIKGNVSYNGSVIINNGDLILGKPNESSSIVKITNSDNQTQSYTKGIENNKSLVIEYGNVTVSNTKASYQYAVYSSAEATTVFNNGTIKTSSGISSYGLSGGKSVIMNGGTINLEGGSNLGGLGALEEVTMNGGTINIKGTSKKGSPTLYGIAVGNNGVPGNITINSGNITVSASSGFTYGIYMSWGGTVRNSGNITSRTNGSSFNRAYGISSLGNGSNKKSYIYLNDGSVNAFSLYGESNSVYNPTYLYMNGGIIKSKGANNKTYGIRKTSSTISVVYPTGKKLIEETNSTGLKTWYLGDE